MERSIISREAFSTESRSHNEALSLPKGDYLTPTRPNRRAMIDGSVRRYLVHPPSSSRAESIRSISTRRARRIPRQV